jgi:O-succinylbenzoic acid--CoA ligase
MTELSIFAAAHAAPHRIALVTETADYTFEQLATLTLSRAAALARFAGPALLLKPQWDLDSLLWLYAAWATGTPVLALPRSAPEGECLRAQRLTRAREPPVLGPSSFVEQAIDPEKAYALLWTSGSSGAPKIVESSRRAALASAAASALNLGIDPEERWLLCLPLSHMGGLAILVRMLVARRTVVLFTRGDLGARINAERVTLVSLVPALLDRLLRSGYQPASSLRAVLLGGAGCAVGLAERARHARVPLVTSYGLTETGSQVVARPYADRYDLLPEREGVVSAGQPLNGVEIKLVAGRIAIKSAALLSAYIPASTALDGDGWFLTNDRGVFGSRGELYVQGRSDLMLITGGENVDPEAVERALCALPEIESACVFGVPCAELGQRVVAVVVPARHGVARDGVARDGVALDPAALEPARLRAALDRVLMRAHIPRRFIVAAVLPQTASGKLDRTACVAEFGAVG